MYIYLLMFGLSAPPQNSLLLSYFCYRTLPKCEQTRRQGMGSPGSGLVVSVTVDNMYNIMYE